MGTGSLCGLGFGSSGAFHCFILALSLCFKMAFNRVKQSNYRVTHISYSRCEQKSDYFVLVSRTDMV